MTNFEEAFKKFPELETSRFILREVKQRDYKDFYDIYSNDDAVKYQQIKAMETLEQAHKSVAWFLKGYKDKKFIRWCIEDKKDKKVIGLVSLHSFDRFNLNAQIGFILNKNYWRQSVMSEAGSRVIRFSFEDIQLHRIEALIDTENIASIKLCMKLGFKQEGLKKEAAHNKRTGKFEDRLIYGLLNI